SVFVGMQPLLTQVPPNRLRSIIATFIPVSASRTARDGPAWPVPITIASYLVAIGHASARVTLVYNFQSSYQSLRTTCTLRSGKVNDLESGDNSGISWSQAAPLRPDQVRIQSRRRLPGQLG